MGTCSSRAQLGRRAETVHVCFRASWRSVPETNDKGQASAASRVSTRDDYPGATDRDKTKAPDDAADFHKCFERFFRPPGASRSLYVRPCLIERDRAPA